MNKKLFSLFLSITILFTLTAPVFAAENTFKNVDFQYSITPEMDEWKNLQSLDEMIEACQIPTTILNHLSTEKLIDVVLDYPLAINIFAYDTPKEGITQLASYFNGLQELVERDDAVELMSAQLVSFSEMKSVDTVKELFAESVFGMLTASSEEPINFDLQRSEIHHNFTPNGTRVQFIYNLTWADHDITASRADELNEDLKSTYVNATPLREENPAYNCHSYAWYSTSTGNLYWLNQSGASSYMADGSYISTTAPQSGDKVWYGSADHSAIYYRNSTVTSKWGALGLFRHNVSYCPYSASSVSYWKAG